MTVCALKREVDKLSSLSKVAYILMLHLCDGVGTITEELYSI